MEVKFGRAPTTDEPVRDRLADVLGVIPMGTLALLDKVWTGETWQRRPLGEASRVVEDIRGILMESAVATYVDRCRNMTRWWTSDGAQTHRYDRLQDVGKRQYAATLKRKRQQLEKWRLERARVARKRAKSSRAPPPDPASIASRLTRERKQWVPADPLILLEDKLPEEYEAEAEHDGLVRGGRAKDLPWF